MTLRWHIHSPNIFGIIKNQSQGLAINRLLIYGINDPTSQMACLRGNIHVLKSEIQNI